MTSEAQKRADAKYKKANTKQLSIRFFPKDRQLWEWVQAQPNKASYIKNLIASDMQREK